MGPDWPALTGCYSLLQQQRGSWTAAELSFHEVFLVCKCFLYPGRNYAEERRGRRRIPEQKLKMLRTSLQPNCICSNKNTKNNNNNLS